LGEADFLAALRGGGSATTYPRPLSVY